MKTKITHTLLAGCFVLCLAAASQAQTWTTIATDPTGDAGGGLDATELSYYYDAAYDILQFKITCANLANFSTGPAADLSFGLPYGMDGGFAPGYHWTAMSTPVHKIAYIYCDPGGMAPSSYTFNNYANEIQVASTAASLCTDCIDVFADVPNNWIIYTMDRTAVITDTELNGNFLADIVIVANAGHDDGWDDNITTNSMFTLDFSTGIHNVTNDGGINVFPTVSKGMITINLKDASAVKHVRITGLTGNVIREFEGPFDNELEVETQSFAAGTYFVTVGFHDSGTATKPFSVQ